MTIKNSICSMLAACALAEKVSYDNYGYIVYSNDYAYNYQNKDYAYDNYVNSYAYDSYAYNKNYA